MVGVGEVPLEGVPVGAVLLLVGGGLVLVFLSRGTGLTLLGALAILGGLACAAWGLKSKGKKCPGCGNSVSNSGVWWKGEYWHEECADEDREGRARPETPDTCGQCGAHLIPSARFCPRCGTTTQSFVSSKGRASEEQVTQTAAREVYKEQVITREIVKIRCRHCGKLYEERLDTCPHCGAGS